MNGLIAALTIAGFFVLRLAIPLLFILLVGFGMSRLDAYWQAHP
jgi:hypothetical protein